MVLVAYHLVIDGVRIHQRGGGNGGGIFAVIQLVPDGAAVHGAGIHQRLGLSGVLQIRYRGGRVGKHGVDLRYVQGQGLGLGVVVVLVAHYLIVNGVVPCVGGGGHVGGIVGAVQAVLDGAAQAGAVAGEQGVGGAVVAEVGHVLGRHHDGGGDLVDGHLHNVGVGRSLLTVVRPLGRDGAVVIVIPGVLAAGNGQRGGGGTRNGGSTVGGFLAVAVPLVAVDGVARGGAARCRQLSALEIVKAGGLGLLGNGGGGSGDGRPVGVQGVARQLTPVGHALALFVVILGAVFLAVKITGEGVARLGGQGVHLGHGAAKGHLHGAGAAGAGVAVQRHGVRHLAPVGVQGHIAVGGVAGAGVAYLVAAAGGGVPAVKGVAEPGGSQQRGGLAAAHRHGGVGGLAVVVVIGHRDGIGLLGDGVGKGDIGGVSRVVAHTLCRGVSHFVQAGKLHILIWAHYSKAGILVAAIEIHLERGGVGVRVGDGQAAGAALK